MDMGIYAYYCWNWYTYTKFAFLFTYDSEDRLIWNII